MTNGEAPARRAAGDSQALVGDALQAMLPLSFDLVRPAKIEEGVQRLVSVIDAIFDSRPGRRRSTAYGKRRILLPAAVTPAAVTLEKIALAARALARKRAHKSLV